MESVIKIAVSLSVANFIEQTLRSDGRFLGQDIALLLWKLTVHYRVYKMLLPVTVRSQMNTVQTLTQLMLSLKTRDSGSIAAVIRKCFAR
jgi:hypothetical protein